MSPAGLASAGIAKVRKVSSPVGFAVSVIRLLLSGGLLIPATLSNCRTMEKTPCKGHTYALPPPRRSKHSFTVLI
jgi:hypothetical protein